MLPGSIGTLAELAVAWNLAFVTNRAGATPKPVITVGADWEEITADLASALETDGSLVFRARDVAAAVGEMARRVPVQGV